MDSRTFFKVCDGIYLIILIDYNECLMNAECVPTLLINNKYFLFLQIIQLRRGMVWRFALIYSSWKDLADE